MNKKILHNFFAGLSSHEEGMMIKKWMESSDENKHLFFKERQLFDAILLSEPDSITLDKKRLLYRSIVIKSLKVAGVAILLLSIIPIYNNFIRTNMPEAMNTISVPSGQRTFVTLSDGTTVWLNARTTLQYPVTFDRTNRTVILKGEAFFDVEKNEKVPFIVKTELYNVEVLGTEFNIEAYPDQNNFETTLMQGSVKIIQDNTKETIMLKPDQKAFLKEGKLLVEQVDDMNPYKWKEGLICFKNDSFNEIVTQFEKYYGIQIVIDNPELTKYTYTGKFRQSDGVDYALRVLQKTIQFSYEKNNDEQKIYIY